MVYGEDILYSGGVGHVKIPWFACLDVMCSVHRDDKLCFYRSLIRRRMAARKRYILCGRLPPSVCGDEIVTASRDVKFVRSDVAGGKLEQSECMVGADVGWGCYCYDEMDTAEDVEVVL